jgi:hypothetical protein
MRRMSLGTLWLAALLFGLLMLFLCLRVGRALQPTGNVITHEIKNLVATLQATMQAPFGVEPSPGATTLQVTWLLWGAGVALGAALVWLVLRRRAQQRARSSSS